MAHKQMGVCCAGVRRKEILEQGAYAASHRPGCPAVPCLRWRSNLPKSGSSDLAVVFCLREGIFRRGGFSARREIPEQEAYAASHRPGCPVVPCQLSQNKFAIEPLGRKPPSAPSPMARADKKLLSSRAQQLRSTGCSLRPLTSGSSGIAVGRRPSAPGTPVGNGPLRQSRSVRPRCRCSVQWSPAASVPLRCGGR